MTPFFPLFSTDEDPSLGIENFAIVNLRGVCGEARSCKCIFFGVYRPCKESISTEMNNDDLNLHSMTKLSDWLHHTTWCIHKIICKFGLFSGRQQFSHYFLTRIAHLLKDPRRKTLGLHKLKHFGTLLHRTNPPLPRFAYRSGTKLLVDFWKKKKSRDETSPILGSHLDAGSTYHSWRIYKGMANVLFTLLENDCRPLNLGWHSAIREVQI